MLKAHDVVLLCSDGLWGAFSDAEIAEHMSLKKMSLGELTQRLASMAEKKSVPNADNVSVVTLKVDQIDPVSRAKADVSDNADQETGSKTALESAIDQMQQVMAEYEDELDPNR